MSGAAENTQEESPEKVNRRRFLRGGLALSAGLYAAPSFFAAKSTSALSPVPTSALIEFCSDPGGFCLAPGETYCAYQVVRILAGNANGENVCEADHNIFVDRPTPGNNGVICVTPCPFGSESECLDHIFQIVGTNCVFEAHALGAACADCSGATGIRYRRIS